jgi:hypothetical protein
MPEFNSIRAPSLLGLSFSKWTVVEYAGRGPNREHRWLCRCECGRERVVSGKRLRNGKSTACQSCAVKRGKTGQDMVGFVFGRWTVLRFSHRGDDRRIFWICRCECGREQPIAGSELRYGNTYGCRMCKSLRQQRKAWKGIWNAIRSNANERGLEFKITPKLAFAILEGQGYRCALTGLPIDIAKSGRGHKMGGTTASLDRIDSLRGYVPGNIQWLHKDVNKMKWDLSQARFIEICRMVAREYQCE